MTEAMAPRRRRGCFLYGCLFAAVLGLLVVAGIIFGVRYSIQRLAERYTGAHAVSLPHSKLSKPERKAFDARWTAFQKEVQHGTRAQPFRMNEDELNYYLETESPFRDKVYVRVQGGRLVGKFSIPLSDLAKVPGFSPFKGRYFNGEATLSPRMEGGKLIIDFHDLRVKDKPLPKQFVEGLKSGQMNREIYRNSKLTALFKRLRSIEVKDGALVLTPKSSVPAPVTPEAVPSSKN